MPDSNLATLLATLDHNTRCLHPPYLSGVPYLPCGKPLEGGGFMRGRCPEHGDVGWLQQAFKLCWEQRLTQNAHQEQRLTEVALQIAVALAQHYGVAIDWRHLKALFAEHGLKPNDL